MRTIPSLIALATAVALSSAAPAAGAQHAADTTRDAPGVADTAQLHPVVVTATRVALPQPASVATTAVLTGAELRSRGITTLQDALRTVPGAFAPRAGSFGAQTSLFLRGGQSDYAQVLVDGVPVNDPGGFIDLANLTTDDVARIEIVRGPASVLYGANAVTGVVQIFTRTGNGPLHGTLSADGGSYGGRDLSGSVAAGGQRAGFAVSAAHHATNGIYAFNSQARDNVASATGRFAPDARTTVRASVRYIDAGAHIPTDFTGAVVDSNQLHTERRWIGSVQGTRRIGDRLEARLVLGATNGATRSADGADSPDDACDFCFDSRAGTYRRTLDARLSYGVTPALVVSGGAAVEGQRQHTWGSPAMRRDVRAWYAEAVGTVRDAVSYSVGARLDDNSAFGTFGTWRAAAAWRLGGSRDAGTSVRASVGTAFKEPTFDQVSSTSPFARGNPALRPEHATTWEAGVDQRFAGGALTVAATYFHQRFRDVIQYDPAPAAADAPNYYNLVAANANGVELEARIAPSRAWGITAGYTHLDTRVLDAGVDAGASATYVQGDRLLRRPSEQGTVALSLRPLSRVALHADVAYVGDRLDIDYRNFVRVEAPSYTTAGLAAELAVLAPALTSGGGAGSSGDSSASWRAPSLTLTVRIDNIFDARYAPIYGFRAPGRTAMVGARVGW
ncbi:MAG TPA: TonB-dependent receptor [Gemmatimonadaceae bacterium]